MFEANQEVSEAVERVYRLLLKYNRGDIVPNDKIREAIGEWGGEREYRYVRKRALRLLQKKKKIASWPEWGTGVRLFTIDETLTLLPKLRLKKAERQSWKTLRSLEELPTTGLSSHQIFVKAAQIELITDQIRKAKKDAKHMELHLRKTETLPR